MSELPGYLKLAKEEAQRASDDDLVRKHLPLAVAIANRVRPPGLAYDDRLGVANLALVEAARTYPCSPAAKKGISFGAYATVRIRRAILRAARASWPVYVPPDLAAQSGRVAQAAARLDHAMGRSPTDEEVAAELGWSVDVVRGLRRLLLAPEALSIDVLMSNDEDDATPWAEALADPAIDVEAEVGEKVDGARARQALAQAVDSLPPLMRAAVSLRAGIPVPNAERLTVDTVLRVAAHLADYTLNGLAKLREEHADALQPYHPEPTGVVGDDGGPLVHFGRAPASPESEARRHFAEDFWRRLASSGRLPPALAGVTE